MGLTRSVREKEDVSEMTSHGDWLSWQTHVCNISGGIIEESLMFFRILIFLIERLYYVMKLGHNKYLNL